MAFRAVAKGQSPFERIAFVVRRGQSRDLFQLSRAGNRQRTHPRILNGCIALTPLKNESHEDDKNSKSRYGAHGARSLEEKCAECQPAFIASRRGNCEHWCERARALEWTLEPANLVEPVTDRMSGTPMLAGTFIGPGSNTVGQNDYSRQGIKTFPVLKNGGPNRIIPSIHGLHPFGAIALKRDVQNCSRQFCRIRNVAGSQSCVRERHSSFMGPKHPMKEEWWAQQDYSVHPWTPPLRGHRTKARCSKLLQAILSNPQRCRFSILRSGAPFFFHGAKTPHERRMVGPAGLFRPSMDSTPSGPSH